jgi:hypothetical protein
LCIAKQSANKYLRLLHSTKIGFAMTVLKKFWRN